ncbi:alpha/beta hydrolase [Archangium sp.]|uniref:alpha/beta fold hydrolase n=1 Tax=Archangium sp. TaxID=1872627 RepID=UPI002D341F5C|nr:alpha/beta hydrolase [Archangium sp.]HYO55153.1 alpha/beta hydrolase [Archangium sp.]
MRSSRLGFLGCAFLCALVAACTHHAPRSSTEPSLASGEHQRILNGVRLYYRIAGEAPAERAPVLFLHGGPGYNSYSFARLMGTRLEKNRRMVYLDQRGCGRSERPWDGRYSLDVLVADLEALRQELGVERWVLLGHSFGGTLALEYAARHPERVAGVVYVSGISDAASSFSTWKRELERLYPGRLTAAGTSGDTSDYAQVMRALRGLDARTFFNQLQFRNAKYQQKQEALDAESGLRNTGELSQALFSTELPRYRFSAAERVTAPVLVIGGRYDYSIGLESMKTLVKALPHATLLEYEQSGHFPYLEESERFEWDVTQFLSSLP